MIFQHRIKMAGGRAEPHSIFPEFQGVFFRVKRGVEKNQTRLRAKTDFEVCPDNRGATKSFRAFKKPDFSEKIRFFGKRHGQKNYAALPVRG